jgi:hypothetical protein
MNVTGPGTGVMAAGDGAASAQVGSLCARLQRLPEKAQKLIAAGAYVAAIPRSENPRGS